MQWVRYKRGQQSARIGLVCGTEMFDGAAVYAHFRHATGLTVVGADAAFAAGALGALLRCSARAPFFHWLGNPKAWAELPTLTQDAVQLVAPLDDPGRFIGVGLNYHTHAREMGQSPPIFPPLFAKWANCIIGPHAPIMRPYGCTALDYEAELGIVIGHPIRHATHEAALDAVFGYTIVNDVSARDWQFRTSQWLAGKVSDGFAPLGPVIVERDDIDDPQDLRIRTWVNGEARQDGHTGDMIFGVAALISALSTLFTLEPGDIIASGTPGGVGMSTTPPRYLAPGDHVRMTISGIGTIENTVIDEPTGVSPSR
ncbi:MAG: fumarylacetoacetate hydrolase family protein [Acidiferrobacter sp.]